MTTNLLISYPDIPFRATMSTNGTVDPDHPITNTVTGERGKRFALSTAGTWGSYLQYDLGASATATIDHLIIARASLLKQLGGTTFQLISSSDGATWTEGRAGTSYDLQTKTFDGVRGEDIIFTQAYNTDYGTLAGSERRYWRLYFGASSALMSTFGKVYFGTFFDFERDPIYSLTQSRKFYRSGDRAAVFNYTFEWQGITNDKRNEFFTKIVDYADVNPVFLYDTNDLILNGYRLFHCWVRDVTVTPVTSQYNTVQVTFEELI